MKTIWIASGCLAVLAPLALAGCRERTHVTVVHREPVVVEERHVIVEERPSETIIVEEAPPPPIVEVRPAPPVVGYVWIGGYYSWHPHDHRYVWMRGHYAPPPHHGAVWVHDRWDHSHRGYEYRPGHWR